MIKKANRLLGNLFLNLSISTRLIIFLVVFTALPTIVVFNVSKGTTSKIFNNYTTDFVFCSNAIISETMTSFYKDTNIMALRFIQNKELYNVINNNNMSQLEKEAQFQKIAKNIIGIDGFVSNVDVITKDNILFSYHTTSGIPTLKKSFVEEINKSSKLLPGGLVQNDNGDYYLTVGRNIRSFNTNYQLGSIVLYINENRIHDMYKSTKDSESTILILNKNGQVYSSDYGGVIGTNFPQLMENNNRDIITYNDKSYMLYKEEIKDEFGVLPEKMVIVNIVSQKHIWKLLSNMDIYLNVLQIFILITVCVLILYIFRKIIMPITRLKENMRLFGRGYEIADMENYVAKDEMEELEETFYNMVHQIKALITKNNIEKEKQRESELKALQAQINPHFIYNALDSISFMAKSAKQKNIEDAIYALASFFRISLHKGDKFITVAEELEQVKSYIAIEKIRFANSFDVEIDVEDEILDCKILKIILQPIVENSIKHGFADKKCGGVISIFGYIVQEEIHLEVVDNGCGFQVEEMQSKYNSNSNKRSYGIGNVNQRIALEYGEKYAINYYSTIGSGTRAEIIIPITKKSDTKLI